MAANTYLSKRGMHSMTFPNFFKVWNAKASAIKYNKETNPQGLVSFGQAEVTLSEDLIAAKISNQSSHSQSTCTDSYDHGTLSFRQVLAEFISERLHSKVPLHGDDITVTSGVGASLDLMAHALADPGDYFMTPTPYYTRICTDIAERGQVKIFEIPLTSQLEEGDTRPFQLTLRKVEKAYQQAKQQGCCVKAIILLNPNNPLGEIYSPELLTQILHFAHREQLHVIMDEIFALSVFDSSASFRSVLSLPDIPDPQRTHLVWGISKDFGISGFRTGAIHTWNKHVTESIKPLCYFAAVPAIVQSRLETILKDKDWLDGVYFPTHLARMKKAYDYLSRELAEMGVPTLKSTAGFFIWADFRKYLKSRTHEAEFSLFKKLFDDGVYIIPGQALFCKEPGWFRLIYTLQPEYVAVGLERLRSILKSLEETPNLSPECLKDGGTSIPDISSDLDLEFVAGTSNGAPPFGLEGLLQTLSSQMKSSDWLKQNTADQWEKENPEVAVEYRKAASAGDQH